MQSMNPNAPAPASAEDEGVPVSTKIRERLKAARQRYHANDNIASFIQPGELEQLLDEVTAKMQGVLESLVIDTEDDHNTPSTARRVAKMYVNEVFKGRYAAAPAITEFPNAERLNELMIVGPITVRSACSHHFCPVMGKLWIGVMPNERTNVIGLSKYARLAEWVMGRPQIQEEAVVQLANLIQQKTRPDGLALVMQATHFCMAWRGVKDVDSKMINSVMRGVFLTQPNLRREFLSLSRAAEPASSTIASICQHSQPRNAERGITGVLVCGDGVFMQAIEGGRAAVNSLYGEILRDARHRDVVLLRYEEITERRFAGWTMGVVDTRRINPAILLKYSERAALDPYALPGQASLALLEELVATASIGRA